jgi:hypothetical protein
MKEKITQNIDLKYFISRVVSSSVKLAVCAIAPSASTKMFSSNTDSISEVVSEVAGASGGKLLSFITCGANVVTNDVIDTVNWISEIDIIEDFLEYASQYTKPSGDLVESESIDINTDAKIDELIPAHNDTSIIVDYA